MKRGAVSQRTRQAILDALAEVIVESGGLGFSVQQVADRAGVTHRTVYNHFPTREALNDGLAQHVEDELASLGPLPRLDLSLARIADDVDTVYRGFQAFDTHVRAYVMLMVASRGPAQLHRDRTSSLEAMIEREAELRPPATASRVTAAVRMFASSTGWHLLTEHLGLSADEAAATAVWATRALLDAATTGGRQS